MGNSKCYTYKVTDLYTMVLEAIITFYISSQLVFILVQNKHEAVLNPIA